MERGASLDGGSSLRPSLELDRVDAYSDRPSSELQAMASPGLGSLVSSGRPSIDSPAPPAMGSGSGWRRSSLDAFGAPVKDRGQNAGWFRYEPCPSR